MARGPATYTEGAVDKPRWQIYAHSWSARQPVHLHAINGDPFTLFRDPFTLFTFCCDPFDHFGS
eukprot:408644-Heterocapsa_arctica.AAC.1